MSALNPYDSQVYLLSCLVGITLLYGTDILKPSNSSICYVWELSLALYKITVL